jgi:hypothetical protein
MADKQWKEVIKYFRTGYSFVQRVMQTHGKHISLKCKGVHATAPIK